MTRAPRSSSSDAADADADAADAVLMLAMMLMMMVVMMMQLLLMMMVMMMMMMMTRMMMMMTMMNERLLHSNPQRGKSAYENPIYGLRSPTVAKAPSRSLSCIQTEASLFVPAFLLDLGPLHSLLQSFQLRR